jgi:hypothetical protein
METRNDAGRWSPMSSRMTRERVEIGACGPKKFAMPNRRRNRWHFLPLRCHRVCSRIASSSPSSISMRPRSIGLIAREALQRALDVLHEHLTNHGRLRP